MTDRILTIEELDQIYIGEFETAPRVFAALCQYLFPAEDPAPVYIQLRLLAEQPHPRLSATGRLFLRAFATAAQARYPDDTLFVSFPYMQEWQETHDWVFNCDLIHDPRPNEEIPACWPSELDRTERYAIYNFLQEETRPQERAETPQRVHPQLHWVHSMVAYILEREFVSHPRFDDWEGLTAVFHDLAGLGLLEEDVVSQLLAFFREHYTLPLDLRQLPRVTVPVPLEAPEEQTANDDDDDDDHAIAEELLDILRNITTHTDEETAQQQLTRVATRREEIRRERAAVREEQPATDPPPTTDERMSTMVPGYFYFTNTRTNNFRQELTRINERYATIERALNRQHNQRREALRSAWRFRSLTRNVQTVYRALPEDTRSRFVTLLEHDSTLRRAYTEPTLYRGYLNIAQQHRRSLHRIRGQQRDTQREFAKLRQKQAREELIPAADTRIDIEALHEEVSRNPHVFRTVTLQHENQLLLDIWLNDIVMEPVITEYDEEEYGIDSDAWPDIALHPMVLRLVWHSDVQNNAMPTPHLVGNLYGGFNNALPHPHWISTNSPCLGDFGPAIVTANQDRNLALVAYLFIQYLSQYAPSDPAGRAARNWEGPPTHTVSIAEMERSTLWYHVDNPGGLRNGQVLHHEYRDRWPAGEPSTLFRRHVITNQPAYEPEGEDDSIDDEPNEVYCEACDTWHDPEWEACNCDQEEAA